LSLYVGSPITRAWREKCRATRVGLLTGNLGILLERVQIFQNRLEPSSNVSSLFAQRVCENEKRHGSVTIDGHYESYCKILLLAQLCHPTFMPSLNLFVMSVFSIPAALYEPFSSYAPLHSRTSFLLSASSRILCNKNPFKSLQNSSVASTSFPLGPCATGALVFFVSGADTGGVVSPLVGGAEGALAVAPPVTMTVNSASSFGSDPITSATVLLSATGFFA
jgi:hypothetical protein